MTLRLQPVDLATAKAFVYRHHRHNPIAPPSWRFGVAVVDDEAENPTMILGVAIAGRPAARKLDGPDGAFTVEITRTCTTGEPNVNSMLYGAICRAAKALGYRSAVTYTVEGESGASLRAAGFVLEATVTPPVGGWHTRPKQLELLGTPHRPDGPKYRWRRQLAT